MQVFILIAALNSLPSKGLASLYGQPLPVAIPLEDKVLTLKWIDRSTTSRSRLYLEDLAQCETPSALCQDALAIDLGPSPQPGMEKTINVDEIMKVIKEEIPGPQLHAADKRRLRVLGAREEIDQKEVRSALEEKLSEEQGAYRFHLTQMRLPSGLKLRHKRYSYSFPNWDQDISAIKANPRRSLVQILLRLIDQDPGSKESSEAMLQVMLRTDVKAAQILESLMKAQPLTKKAFSFQWVPYQDNLIREGDDLDRRLLRSNVRQGHILRTFDLVRDPEVKRGERVQASLIAQGVKMDSSAEAMESAGIGQRVRVKLDTSRRQVMATVIGPDRVEVQLP